MSALHVIEIRLLSEAARQFQNALHGPGFGLVAIGIMFVIRPTPNPHAAYLTALVLGLLIGATSEALQFLSSRDANIHDLGWNVIGVVGFLAVAACIDPQVRRRLPRANIVVMLLFGAVALSLTLVPVVTGAWVLSSRALAFPVIASFDHSWEAAIYRPFDPTQLSTMQPPAKWPIQRGHVMLIDFAPIQYSGIAIDAYPDWTDFKTISFLTASADGQEHDVVIRIHDAEHNSQYQDRFNRVIQIGPDVDRHVIAFEDIQNSVIARAFDFSSVAGIVIFMVDATGDERIFIDDIRLE